MLLFFSGQKSSNRSEPFGTLLAIRHESSGGSMIQRSEFSIELTTQEIVQCTYWPQDYKQDMVIKNHVPVTARQWEDVAHITEILWPLFHETSSSPQINLPADMRVLDGGDYNRWFLTRQTEHGVYTAQYSQPDDRRIRTLVALLREIAEPIGREIPRFRAPRLYGIYYSNEKMRCSYQCTVCTDGEGYRFIANDHVKNEKRSVYKRVANSVWDEIFSFLNPYGLDQFPNAAMRDTVSCTLYFSDGRQKRVAPDAKTAKKLKDFLANLTDRVQNGHDKKGDT